jgi:hypothetical protein
LSESRYAMATRDELWSRGRLLERRLSYGEAHLVNGELLATDTPDAALLEACTAAMNELRTCVIPDYRMRLVSTASTDGNTTLIIVTDANNSIVTTPSTLLEDMHVLRNAGVPAAGQAASRRLPILWTHGTAAVLLHELIGHPLELSLPTALPSWLTLDIPLAKRRATFRDIPLLRMQHVIAHQHDAPFALPDTRIEILLVDEGHYDALTDRVTLHVGVADLVERTQRTRLAPFTFEAQRNDIHLTGATGEPLRYPGVICSREGQELFVPSHAPLLLTELA